VNSKELIAAAENCCTDSRLEWVDLDTPGFPIREDMMMDAYRLSQHILGTVRADDDEDVHPSWFESLISQDGLRTIENVLAAGNRCRCFSRGEFRQLCRLLGVVLKEGE